MTSNVQILEAENCWVGLTEEDLDISSVVNRVRSPKAGAIVLFAGTTRDSFENKTVKHLEYESYKPKALKTMLSIAQAILNKHSLTSIAMVHRLGLVPIGEDSIYIAVSSPHRQAAWRAGEEALERCKDDVEVWKKEEFEGEGGIWRANRDGKAGLKVMDEPESASTQNSPLAGLHAPLRDVLGDDGTTVMRPKSRFEKGHGPVIHPRKE